MSNFFIKKYVSVYKMYVYNTSNFENQIQNRHRETKKRNLTKNSVTKRQKYKWHYSCIDLSFLFLHVHFEFGSKKFRDGKPMSSEH
jgi:hypothetical protein